MKSELRITIQDDGTLKIDARKMAGSSDQIREGLKELANFVGGDFREEKHEHGMHTHQHRHVKA